MPRTFYTNASGSALIGSTTVCVVDGTYTEESSQVDTTNSCDAGKESFIAGPTKISGSIKSYWDSSNNLWSTATLSAGTSVTLTLNLGSSGKSFVVPAIITKISQGFPVKGAIPFDFDWLYNPSAGSIVRPT